MNAISLRLWTGSDLETLGQSQAVAVERRSRTEDAHGFQVQAVGGLAAGLATSPDMPHLLNPVTVHVFVARIPGLGLFPES